MLAAASLPALAGAQTPASSCLAKSGTLSQLAASGGCAVTMTLSDAPTGVTPQTIGVNLGHHHQEDGSWAAFIEHLGVNGA